MRHWRITGNSSVAIQHGSTYISDSITDINAIPTANLVFDHTQSDDTDAGWLRRRPTTGNGTVDPQTGNTYISGSTADRMTVLTANYGFSTTPRSHKLTLGDCDNGQKLQYGRFARQSRNLWQSVVVAIIWLIFCRARHHRKSRIWRWNLDAICQSFKDVITSGFGVHIDISGYRSLLYLLANIILHLYNGLIPPICRWNFNCTFHSLRDIIISGFRHNFRLSLIIGIA